MTIHDKTASTLQEALQELRGQYMLLDKLLDRGAPVTREMYLREDYCGEVPDPLSAELEAQLPEPLRIWSPYQSKVSPASPGADGEPLNAMEEMLLRLDAKLRASGCAVTVRKPSDSNEFVATFPSRRRQIKQGGE